MNHRREPRHRYSNSNDRADIVAFDPDKGCNVDLDIALAHLWSSDIFPRSSESDNVAAGRRKERKKAKYATENLVSRSQTRFRRGLPGEMGSGVRPLMSLCAA